MSKLRKFYRDHTGVAVIGFAACLIIIVGLSFSAIVLYNTYNDDKLYELEFCLSSSCVSLWINKNTAAFQILAASGGLLTGLITLGGILVALSSYQNSVNTSALTNHLSHLSIFSNYVYSEIDKRDRLAKSEIDVLKWYNLIYNSSRLGKFQISKDYIELISKIDTQIASSNHLYLNSGQEKYEYRNHQTSMMALMLSIGVSLHRLPRLDFNEVENQVLELIHTVNRSFCADRKWENFTERKYK